MKLSINASRLCRYNTINHGAYCVNETVHVMSNPEAYAFDPTSPGEPASCCYGCKSGGVTA